MSEGLSPKEAAVVTDLSVLLPGHTEEEYKVAAIVVIATAGYHDFKGGFRAKAVSVIGKLAKVGG